MIHAAMSPVLNVEGVGHFLSPLWSTIGSLVVWSLCLCGFPPVQVVEGMHMVQYSTEQYSTVDRDQLHKVTLRDYINSVL
jgi:hypothetical protein